MDKPEEQAVKDVGYQKVLEILAMTDPNMYEVFQIIENVRKHGYGKIELNIIAGKVSLVNQTFSFKTT